MTGFTGIATAILAELIVQVLTWKMTGQVWRTLKRMNMAQPLILLLLRDGAWSISVANRSQADKIIYGKYHI